VGKGCDAGMTRSSRTGVRFYAGRELISQGALSASLGATVRLSRTNSECLKQTIAIFKAGH
jgi:hypothetical protein